MKTFVAFLAFVLVICQTLADCDEEERRIEMKKFHMHMKECADEFEIQQGQFRRIPDDKKCFYKCLLVKSKLMNENGDVDFDRFKESHKCMPESMLETNRKCSEDVEDSDPCEKASKISKCMKKEMHKHHHEMFKVIKECAQKYDIPKDTFKKHLPIPEDKKCFYKCVAVKFHMMNEDGEFTIEEFKKSHKKIPKHIMSEIEECADSSEEDDDACEVAKEFGECLREKQKKHHPHHHHHHHPDDEDNHME